MDPNPEKASQPIPIPIDSEPPPSYEYVMMNMEQLKNQNVPPQPPPIQPSVISHMHLAHHHPHHPGLRPFPSKFRGYPEPHLHRQRELEIQRYRKPDRDPSNMKNLVCLYAIGFLDMITSAILIASMSRMNKSNQSESHLEGKLGQQGIELEKFSFEHGIILLFRIIQFLMGLILIIALRTPNENSKILCFQIWILGASLLISKDIFLLFGILFKFTGEGQGNNNRLGIFVKLYGIIFRTFWAVVIRKYMMYLRVRAEFRNRLLEVTQDPTVVKEMMQHYAAPGKVCPSQDTCKEIPQNEPV